MKKILALLLATLTVLSVFTAFSASAAEELKTEDGVYTYEIVSDKYIRLLSCVAPEKAELNADGSYTIPGEVDGKPVKYLGEKLFAQNDVPSRKVIVPDTVTHIEKECFYMDDSDKDYYDRYKHVSHLQEIVLSEGLISIGERAFKESRIYRIDLPESLVTIGDYAFEDSYLESVIIPKYVERIGIGAFKSCGELESVVINAPIKKLLTEVFYGADSLTELVLPDTIDKVYDRALYCRSLKSVTLSENAEIENFSGLYYNTKLNLKYASKDNHKNLRELNSWYSTDYIIPKMDYGYTFVAGDEIKLKVDGVKASEWKSDNPSSVRISSSGKAVFLSSGLAHITAKLSDGTEFKCRLRATFKPTVKCWRSSWRDVTKTYIEVKRGEGMRFNINYKAESADNVFKSTKYAKILGNKNDKFFYVYGLKKGKTTVKAIVNGRTIKVKIKVV